jgi:hypothetical protein
VLIVGTDPFEVEADLVVGRLACPPCGGQLGPWGHARWRGLRQRSGQEEAMRPRRARCRMCQVTQVLLADVALIRRQDDAETIGEAAEARARGVSWARIAGSLGRAKETVRGWLRAFAAAAEAIRAHFTRWAAALDPLLGPIEPARRIVTSGRPAEVWTACERRVGVKTEGATNRLPAATAAVRPVS